MARFRLGRTWWVTILTVALEAFLGLLTAAGHAKPEDVVIPAAAIAVVAASHNAGRAWEDGKRNAAQTTGPPGPDPDRDDSPLHSPHERRHLQ